MSYIFRAFQGLLKPQSNLAKTIHAGMVHRDTMGVSLLESSYYDIRDNLLFDVDVKSFKEGMPSTGSAPSQKLVMQRKNSICEIQKKKKKHVKVNMQSNLAKTY